ncbi:Aldo/keto reductase [Microbulbifer donghaiensis]|uniref:Aldo/keto reductase n=1 Tax=Microbulbifer donghaiensis TaxID=494016 RepID=A0A1M4XIT7_9GAMM|nr:aldo/keto reductase [Microbulbifer donghaiensis]SHE93311.1 Aldo/keto reductase [Microbulbifer donghaiensis]
MTTVTLNNGVEIPQLGFGTAAIGEWQQDDSYVTETLLKGMSIGYRHFDTASVYGNERALGRAIKESGLPRQELFITSKVWDSEQGRDTRDAFERSLERLQLDYLDLYLIHWPLPAYTRETWEAMENLYAEKKVRALGLSNFRESDIEQLATFANIRPTCNQIELHPYLTQKTLVDYCQFHKIAVAVWSPLGSGSWSGVKKSEKPISDPLIVELAEKHGVSVGQIILKWNIQQHRIVIPKAESLDNIRNNFLLADVHLSEEELQAIDGLNRDLRFGADPDTAQEINKNIPVPD